MPTPKLTIVVGIPGSGKSTWIKTHLAHATVVSSDEIRARLYGDEATQGSGTVVFGAFYFTIASLLKEKLDVVADSTGLDARTRNELCEIAHDFGADVHLIYFSNLDEAAMQNKQRERVVPDDVMMRMMDKYENFKLLLPQEQSRYMSITQVRSVRG